MPEPAASAESGWVRCLSERRSAESARTPLARGGGHLLPRSLAGGWCRATLAIADRVVALSAGALWAGRRWRRLRMLKVPSRWITYERPLRRTSAIRPLPVHNFVSGSCTTTFCPTARGASSTACAFRRSSALSSTRSRLAGPAGSLSRRTGSGTSGRRSRRPKNISNGLSPSARGVARHVLRAASMPSPCSPHLAMRPLRLLTPASASPLLVGLYGDASSWIMFCSEQNALNSPLNCGPPSVLAYTGRP